MNKLIAIIGAFLVTLVFGQFGNAQTQTDGSPQSDGSPQAGAQNQQTGETQTPQPSRNRAGAVGDGQTTTGNPGRGPYGGRTERPWFSSPGVRQQLGLNDPQYNRLNESYGTSWKRYNESRQGLGSDLAREQRRERLRALRDDFDRDFGSAREEVFTEPDRRSRYDQLYYQYRGYGAFDDPIVQQRLRLSPEQRRQLRQYNRDWSRQMSELNGRYLADPDTARVSYRDLQTQARKRLGTVFTPQQRQQWQELTGEPYEFEPDDYFYEPRTAREPSTATPPNTPRQ